jgi:dihydroorotase
MPLFVHGVSNDPTTDLFDREKLFIDAHLRPLVNNDADPQNRKLWNTSQQSKR